MGAKVLTALARPFQSQPGRSAVGVDRQRELRAAGPQLANFPNAADQVAAGERSADHLLRRLRPGGKRVEHANFGLASRRLAMAEADESPFLAGGKGRYGVYALMAQPAPDPQQAVIAALDRDARRIEPGDRSDRLKIYPRAGIARRSGKIDRLKIYPTAGVRRWLKQRFRIVDHG